MTTSILRPNATRPLTREDIGRMLALGFVRPPRPLSLGEISSWWHGGPEIEGNQVLPPVATGAEPIDAAVDQPKRRLAELASVVDHTKVYVTSNPAHASIYAVLWPEPWLYLVAPSHDLAPDPDASHHPADHWVKYARCSTAAILARLRLDAVTADKFRPHVLGHPLTRRGSGSQRWSPSAADWNRLRPPTFGDLIDSCRVNGRPRSDDSRSNLASLRIGPV